MSAGKICVVDFGTGNLRSVAKAVERVSDGVEVVVSNDAEVVAGSSRLVLPGQGAVGVWMRALQNQRLFDAVTEALNDRPVLGICIGMQALYAQSSEDGGTDCLGLLQGRVVHFRESAAAAIDRDGLKIPHMGWNNVNQTSDHPLWHGIENDSRFYFVHSFHAFEAATAQVAGQCHYGVDFVAAAAHENVFAVQFHPEKSASMGLKMLSNFVRWDGQS